MSRESTSMRALSMIRAQLRTARLKTRSSTRVGASLGPYCVTDHVFEYINQPERSKSGFIRSRPTVLELVENTPRSNADKSILEYGIDRELTGVSVTGKRPKVIPMSSKPIPPFPRLGAVINFKSNVSGKLSYNEVPKVRQFIEVQRKKHVENRKKVEYEITRNTWSRFQLKRIPTLSSTNHFLRAADSYFSSSSKKAMHDSLHT